MTTLENINTNTYYTGKGICGKIVEGSLDLGDYGFQPTVTINNFNGSQRWGVAINKLTETTFEEYADYVELSTGNRPTE